MRVLFICTGNTCRSCMAEAIAKQDAEKLNMPVQFQSAGIYARKGDAASANAIAAMDEMGISLRDHVAVPVTKESIDNANIILTMTKKQKALLGSVFPESINKTFSLMEYIGGNGDIIDPFGGDIYIYRECSKKMKLAIDKLIIKLGKANAF